MRSYLVQRLKKPFKQKEGMSIFMDNPFSFGGGLINGGISKEAMSKLNEIWRYDYMGSAEFEFGALPESLDHIVKNISEYVAGKMEVTGKYNVYDYSIGINNKKEIKKEATVYYICEKKDVNDVCEYIERFADDVKHNYQTKENVGLSQNICKREYYEDNVGWHDIDNHYLFFTDETMFKSFCGLLGLQTSL